MRQRSNDGQGIAVAAKCFGTSRSFGRWSITLLKYERLWKFYRWFAVLSVLRRGGKYLLVNILVKGGYTVMRNVMKKLENKTKINKKQIYKNMIINMIIIIKTDSKNSIVYYLRHSIAKQNVWRATNFICILFKKNCLKLTKMSSCLR